MEKLGQLVMTGISGTSLVKEEGDFIRDHNIGGVILFRHNYENPEQLAKLINDIQANRGDFPLLISVDHEGGRVMRFSEPFTHFPPMEDIAHLGSPKLCFEVHQAMAMELKAAGVNLSFSPVCDLNLNPKNEVIGDRAFSSDPELAAKFVSSAIRGLQNTGVMACAKHFPGHGATVEDSHHELPILVQSEDIFKKREYIPFIQAIKSRVDFIMMAHMKIPEIDSVNPSTMSPRFYQILREELKYKKIIITDDMEMQAMTDHYCPNLASIKALASGADIILFRSFKAARKIWEPLQLAYKKRDLSAKLIMEKVNRIEQVKKNYLENYSTQFVPDVAKNIRKAQGKELKEQIQKKTRK